ncbi:MAG TPA: galactokinase [Acidimicrobiales bacterium]|nr:galactokinase [Acidimicrobiales bacterium]
MAVRAFAPGRVNVIGDHTDYTGGLALPMAIAEGTTVTVERGGDVVRLRSDEEPSPALVPLDVADPAAVDPPWARYVAGVVAELRPAAGATGAVTTKLPLGAGLSSSAALEVAVALALGFEGDALELAQLCQRAEQRASGVPCGIMDQLTSAAGVEGSLLLLDCRALTVTPIPLPAGIAIVGVHSGVARALAGTAYAERRAECAAAEREIGPLRDARPDDLTALVDGVLRRRARHVVTENARVLAFVDALAAGDHELAGAAMNDSHASLRDDFEVSTPAVDALVEQLAAAPGVFGARMTGGGFGGMVIALCDADAADAVATARGGGRFIASAGASLLAC